MTDITIMTIEADGFASLAIEAGLSGFQQHTPVAGIPGFLVIGMVPRSI